MLRPRPSVHRLHRSVRFPRRQTQVGAASVRTIVLHGHPAAFYAPGLMSAANTPRLELPHVRPLTASDAARFRELWAGYLAFYAWTLPEEISEHTWQRLIDPEQQPYGLVAVDENERVLGFVIYHFHLSTWSKGGVCYLEDLFVDAQSRGQRAGYALVQAVYRAAEQHGAERVYWVTQADNTKARALYDRVAEATSFVQYRWTPKAQG